MGKYTIETARKLAGERGGECLSTHCSGIKSRLRWRCACGYEWDASLDNVVHGKTWCGPCAYKRMGVLARCDNLTSARALAEARGGRCLETANFPVHNQKARWECSEGHTWSSEFHDVKTQGVWCPVCVSATRPTIKTAHEIARGRDGTCLSDRYKTNKDPLLWRCSRGHEWTASLHSIKISGSWCPQCLNKTEAICGEVLKELLPKSRFVHTRALPWLRLGKSGYPLELDFYCEELGLAIEYNGGQHEQYTPRFHKTEADFFQQQERDRLKAEACDANDTTLIVVSHRVHWGKTGPEVKKTAITAYLRKEISVLGYLVT